MSKNIYFPLTMPDGKNYTICFDVDQLRQALDQYDKEYNNYNVIVKVPVILQPYLHDITLSVKRKEDSDGNRKVFSRFSEIVFGRKYEIRAKNIPINNERNSEVDKVFSYISKGKKANVALVGGEGSGKSAIVYEVARRIREGNYANFKDGAVFKLNLKAYQNIVNESVEGLDVENEKIQKRILKEIVKFFKSNPNYVLLIDNLLTIAMSSKLSKMFITLVENDVRFILTSTPEIFNDFLQDDYLNALMMSHLNVIEVEETREDDVYPMIKKQVEKLAKKNGVKISERIVKFAIYTSSLSKSQKVNPGLSLEIIEHAISEAKIMGKEEVDKECVYSCYDLDKKLKEKWNEEARKETAYHEAGHYLVVKTSEHLKDLSDGFVTILPMDDFLGLTAPVFKKEVYARGNSDYYIDYIAYALGGRVGESYYTHEKSSGASEDLKQANAIAKYYVMNLALSESDQNNQIFDDEDLLTDEEKAKINREIRDLILKAYNRAKNIIETHKELFEEIVSKLLEENILFSDELDEICAKYEVTDEPNIVDGTCTEKNS